MNAVKNDHDREWNYLPLKGTLDRMAHRKGRACALPLDFDGSTARFSTPPSWPLPWTLVLPFPSSSHQEDIPGWKRAHYRQNDSQL